MGLKHSTRVGVSFSGRNSAAPDLNFFREPVDIAPLVIRGVELPEIVGGGARWCRFAETEAKALDKKSKSHMSAPRRAFWGVITAILKLTDCAADCDRFDGRGFSYFEALLIAGDF